MSTRAVARMGDEDDPDKNNADLQKKDRATRSQAAVALKIAGATYSEIAKALDYPSATMARVAVEKALADSVGDENREQLRFLEARRLERLLRSLWSRATDDTDEQHLSYARTALAVIDRHSRLYGLDAPQEMIVYNPSGMEIEAWVSKMARQVHGEMPEEYDIIKGEISDETPIGDEE